MKSNKSNIGKIMLNFIPYLRMYQTYLNNYDSINDLIHQLRKTKSSPFMRYVIKQEKKDHALESYLILPIQRIPRYELLFKEITKLTPKDHDDYTNLSQCLDKISIVNKDSNDKIKKYDKDTMFYY